MRRARATLAGLTIAALSLAGCGGDADDPAQAGDDPTTDEAPPADDDGSAADVEVEAGEDVEPPVVAVTTNILGDVVSAIAAGQVEVVTIMPTGANPHDFQPSARQVDAMTSADALVVNGGGFEEGLLDVVDAAEGDGVPTYEAIRAVTTIAFDEAGHDHGDDEDGDHGDEEQHDEDHDGADPHFFTDPVRMADAVDALADWLTTELTDVDADAIRAAADAYVAELEALDAEVMDLLAALADEQRVLVTNHEVFGYFADRYGFEVVGAVVPGGTTTDTTSARQLVELAEVVRAEGVRAVFADASSSDDLARALAAEVGGAVAVVELFTESLGEAGSGGATYLEMVRTNAQRIAEALAA